jgi:peptide deformylase
MKSIVRAPNRVLTNPAQTVCIFDKKLANLIDEMERILLSTRRPKGVGLAAPQIGEPYRIFITKPTTKSKIRVFINPEILTVNYTQSDDPAEKKESGKLEGCLSIPDIWGHVDRAREVTLRYQDITGEKHEETITGFFATIIQHETDHTNGILFSQRVAEQKGKFFRSSTDKDGKDVLEEITI